MKPAEYRDKYKEYSRSASGLSRQLAFAGIATIWVMKTVVNGNPTIPEKFLFPMALLVCALFFDLLQYLLGTLIWSQYYRYLRFKNAPLDKEDDAPWFLNKPISAMFYLKVAFVIAAYIQLIRHFWNPEF